MGIWLKVWLPILQTFQNRTIHLPAAQCQTQFHTFHFYNSKPSVPPTTNQQLFRSELEKNNTGLMDITDSSGVQNPLSQPPKGPHPGSRNGSGNFPSVNQGSSGGGRTAERPVHIDSVYGAKSKCRLSPCYQSSVPKLFPGKGVIQDGGLADSKVPNTTRGLYDDIGLEGCILCSTNSFLSQEVSEGCVSKQNMRVPVPTIRPIFGSPSPHKNTETSVGCPTFTGDSDCYLHRRHVTALSTEQCVAGNVWSGGRFPGKTGVSGEEREVLNHPLPADNLSRGPAGLSDNDAFPVSAKTNEHHRHVLSPPSTLIGRVSHASPTGILFAPLHYRGLQRVHLQAVLQYGHRRRVLVPLTSQALDHLNWWVLDSGRANGCPIQLPPIDTTIWTDASNTGWGNLPGDIHWGPVRCRRGEEAHQYLGITSSNTSRAGSLATSAPGTKTCSLADIHKQEGRYTLQCSHSPCPGTMGSGLGCWSIPDSTAHSRHSEYSSRYSFQADRD